MKEIRKQDVFDHSVFPKASFDLFIYDFVCYLVEKQVRKQVLNFINSSKLWNGDEIQINLKIPKFQRYNIKQIILEYVTTKTDLEIISKENEDLMSFEEIFVEEYTLSNKYYFYVRLSK